MLSSCEYLSGHTGVFIQPMRARLAFSASMTCRWVLVEASGDDLMLGMVLRHCVWKPGSALWSYEWSYVY